MTSKTHPVVRSDAHQPHRPPARAEQERLAKQRRTRRLITLALGLVVLGLITLGLISAAPKSESSASPAPAFTLPTTAGTTVSLADFKGRPVLLYFNEGAGCEACTMQMAKIEQDPAFQAYGITVLPIVMNPAEQIERDMQQFGVTTPYLLDDGTVSKAYGTLGTGMHEGLPGHGFVLIDKDGVKKWYGNYPSMYIAPADLLDEVKTHL